MVVGAEPGHPLVGDDGRDLGAGAAEALGRGQDVRPDPVVLGGEHPADPADAGLDLVEDEDDAAFVAQGAQRG